MRKRSTWSAFNKLLKYVYCIVVNITFLKLIESYKGAGEKLSKINETVGGSPTNVEVFFFSGSSGSSYKSVSLVKMLKPPTKSLQKNTLQK